MTHPTWIGKTLRGRYQIEELLGQGGMSAVYKARDPNLGRVVAIKLIHPHLSSDPQFVRRFEEEARAVAQLRHPNIIQVYDFNHDGDAYFIVFEFVPGETLQERLKRLHQSNRRLDLNDTIRIGASLADALAYAHERNLIHRDVKPANVMLNVNNEPILMDFGIVKIMGGTQHTATGAVMGTARYMSPEQIKGERIDERTDIYSLGIMLFEMAGGRVPFEADSAMTVMMMHVSDPVPDLRRLRPDVPASVVQVINRALAKDRADRFQRVGAIATALRSIDLGATKPTPGVTMLDSAPDVTILDSTPTPEPPAPATGVTTLETASEPELPAAATGPAGGTRESPPGPPVTPPVTPPPAGIDSTAPVSSGAPAGSDAARRNRFLMMGAALLVLVLIIGAGILYAAGAFGGNGDDGTPAATSVAGGVPANEAAGATSIPVGAAATATPTQSPTPEPTDTVQPTASPTASPTATATEPPEASARINAITVDNGRYVVQYETTGYTEALPGMHVHFFFDTVPPDQAGVPGAGPWFVYGGPRPFTGYTVADRPAAAEQMCILVADEDHSVRPNSGNCVDLPPDARANAAATTAPVAATTAPVATSTVPPTATTPPEPSVRINSITLENDRYVVSYETFAYTEALPGMHVHFFFDTVPPDQAGVPGSGPWFVYGGPRPFTGYTVADRPGGAQRMCALVANEDHSVRPNSGNCVNLP